MAKVRTRGFFFHSFSINILNNIPFFFLKKFCVAFFSLILKMLMNRNTSVCVTIPINRTVEDFDDWTGWLLYKGGVGVKGDNSWESWWDEEQV